MPTTSPLTNLQRELLAHYFAEKATASFDAFERGLSLEETDPWAFDLKEAIRQPQ